MKLSRSPFILRALTKAIPVLGVLALVSSASATLLLDPAGGTVTSSISVGNNTDDAAYAGQYVFITPFFGSALPPVNPTISVNGHIRFGAGDGDGDWHVTPLGGSGKLRIAPMWGDYQIGATSRIIESASPAFDYYAVTWENMVSTSHNGYFATFQAIFFENATTLHGITFNPGDIAFSYGNIGLYTQINEVVAGLERGTSAATLPGYAGTAGNHSFNNTGAFPVGTNEYVHFRANGSGYNVTIAAIPEPGTTAAALLGGLLLVRRRRR